MLLVLSLIAPITLTMRISNAAASSSTSNPATNNAIYSINSPTANKNAFAISLDIPSATPQNQTQTITLTTPQISNQDPSLTLDPTQGPVGTTVSFTGTGYTPGKFLQIIFANSLFWGAKTAFSLVYGLPIIDQSGWPITSGSISGSFSVPAELNSASGIGMVPVSLGLYGVFAAEVDPNDAIYSLTSASFTVTGAPTPTPTPSPTPTPTPTPSPTPTPTPTPTPSASPSPAETPTTPTPTTPTPSSSPPAETITILSYYGTEVYVKHANSAEWIELSDPTSYVYQEGDTISTVTNSIIKIDLGSHGTVTLDPDSSIFIHTISESDVTSSVTGNSYQQTSDTVTVVHSVVNGVPVDEVTDQAEEYVGDPQFTITATDTSTLIRVFEGVVTLNDTSGHSVSIEAGNQSSITMGQAPTAPEPMHDTTPPSVVSVFPVSWEPSINESMPVSVAFSKAIDPGSAAGSNFTITGSNGAAVNGGWTVLCQTVIFTPQGSLPGGTYVVDVKGGSQGVRDLSGNALPSDYTFTFTVGAAGGVFSISLPVAAAIVAVIIVAIVVAVLALRRQKSHAQPPPPPPTP